MSVKDTGKGLFKDTPKNGVQVLREMRRVTNRSRVHLKGILKMGDLNVYSHCRVTV